MLKRIVHLLSVVALALLLSSIVGVGQVAASSPIKEEKGAKVSVVVVAKSAGADESMLVYDIIAANHRETYARNLTITVPFKAAVLKLVDVQYHHRHRALRQAAECTQGCRAHRASVVRWSVQGRKDSGKSNLSMPLKPYYSLDVSALTTLEGTMQRFVGSIFAPDEPVTFWCKEIFHSAAGAAAAGIPATGR